MRRDQLLGGRVYKTEQVECLLRFEDLGGLTFLCPLN